MQSNTIIPKSLYFSVVGLLVATVGTPVLAVQSVNSPTEAETQQQALNCKVTDSLKYAINKPSKAQCKTATKILTQYKRLAKKYKKKIGAKKMKELDRKRGNGTITINDIPGGLRGDFPTGVFGDLTLNEIKRLCSQSA